MDTVTYPAAEVKREMTHWTFGRVDTNKHPEVAQVFGVEAIPVALAVTSKGEILGRIVGFVAPKPFQEQLAHFRGRGDAH